MLESDNNQLRHKLNSSRAWTTPRLMKLFGQFRQLEEKLGAWLELDDSEEESAATLQRMHEFQVNQDLKLIKELVPDNGSSKETTAVTVLENIQPFFSAGFLLHSEEASEPSFGEFFYRGVLFPLPDRGLPYGRSVPQIGPLQVKAMDARKWLYSANLDFLKADLDSQAFLIQPLPGVSYVLISEVPSLWREEHIEHAHRLINNSFDQIERKDSSL